MKHCWKKFGKHISDIHVVTDNGNAWRALKSSFLKILGFKDHHFLPAVRHHYMSTCDNGTNGPVKAQWKALDYENKVKFTDLPGSTLELLKASQNITIAYIRKCWTNNFLLDINPVECTFHSLQKRFHARSSKYSKLQDECLAEFEAFTRKVGISTHFRSMSGNEILG